MLASRSDSRAEGSRSWRERRDEAGADGDLEQKLGQVDVGEHRVDPRSQRLQAGGLIERVELLKVDPGLGNLEDRMVAPQSFKRARIRRIQLVVEHAHERVRAVRKPERGQGLCAGHRPCAVREQHRSRVAPTVRAADEHVTTVQSVAQLLQRAERVCASADLAGLGLYESPPGAPRRCPSRCRPGEAGACARPV
jgi:hypothetical protein